MSARPASTEELLEMIEALAAEIAELKERVYAMEKANAPF